MARATAHVIGHTPASPDAVWAVVRDFCAPWHPMMTGCQAETDAQGALIRAFTVAGEDTVYRERLTWVSDSDRSLAYTHLDGIAGADSYDARLTVTPAEEGGSVITWTARIAAASARAEDIAQGTEAVFRAGIAALQTVPPPPAPPPLPSAEVALETLILDDLPRLALTVTPPRPGNADGPLVVFLHGIGGARDNWVPQLRLAGQITRAAALDLRGYGGSSLGLQQTTVDDYCDDILRVAEVLGADRLILVGLSYGSWIATSFAMRHPDRLAGLVVSGGCTGMSEAGPEEREAFRISREVPLNEGQVPADFAPAVVKVLIGPDAGEDTRAALLASMAAIPASTYRDAMRCFCNPLERFDFARLTMPVLLMTGEHDRLAPPDEIRGVAGRILDQAPAPDVRFEVIAGAGHVCNVEKPGAYNRPLFEFLTRVAL
ncbi:MAG: alpha/beta fold hydrolase [Rhodobacteraceae bacterium]|jgi:pimeloyl-ACP methyl ester carboxylesterase|nr:alpha/beta fold hydrolase [Paracoccaceae bacterium]